MMEKTQSAAATNDRQQTGKKGATASNRKSTALQTNCFIKSLNIKIWQIVVFLSSIAKNESQLRQVKHVGLTETHSLVRWSNKIRQGT